MPPKTPEAVHEHFLKAVVAGDLDALLALYEPDAVSVPQPAQIVSGLPAIRESLSELLATGGYFRAEGPTASLRSGDLALLYIRWTFLIPGADGNEVEVGRGQTTDIVRRQPDGSWLLVIDNPYGAEGIASPGTGDA